MEQHMNGKKCTCAHHKMVPALIALLGFVFLLNSLALVPQRFADLAWPTIIMLIGLQKLFEHKCRCCGQM